MEPCRVHVAKGRETGGVRTQVLFLRVWQRQTCDILLRLCTCLKVSEHIIDIRQLFLTRNLPAFLGHRCRRNEQHRERKNA